MTEPMDLFATQPYNGTPPHEATATSRAAAASVLESAVSKRARVFQLIKASDATDDELETLTGWRHQTVSARRRELVLLGLVEDAGTQRKTSSGRMATVWRASR